MDKKEDFKEIIRRHAETIKDLIIFQGISHQNISRFIINCKYKKLKKGETIFEEGAQSLDLAVLLEGEADVLKGGKKIVSLTPPALLGEIGLFTGMARNATVKAGVNAVILTMSHLMLDSLFQKEPTLGYKIHKNIIQCLANKINEDNQKIVALADGLTRREATEDHGREKTLDKKFSENEPRASFSSSLEVVHSLKKGHQRKFPRVHIPDPSVCFVRSDGKKVNVKDISEGGLRLSLDNLPDILTKGLQEESEISGTLCIKNDVHVLFSGRVKIVFPNAVGVEFFKLTQNQEKIIADAVSRLRRLAVIV